MDDNLLPNSTIGGSLEIKLKDRVKTNELSEIIIPIKNKKNKKLILYLIIIIMVIISGLITIYFFFFYKSKKRICELGENEKCNTCDEYNYCDSCNPGYKLVKEKGECIVNYSFKAIYKTETPNQEVNLLGNFAFIIEEMIIDGKKVDISRKYTFELNGTHSVLVSVDLSQTSKLESMFSESEMISISFTEKFNTEKIVDMNYMFDSCTKLTSIDLSVFITRNVLDMQGMFNECSSLKSINLSNFNTELDKQYG